MKPISPTTKQHLDVLFSVDDRPAAERALLGWSEDSERLCFAALRLSHGDLRALDEAITLGRTDWRDLLVAADFADDVHAHEAWVPQRLTFDLADRWRSGGTLEGVRFRVGSRVQVRRGALVGGSGERTRERGDRRARPPQRRVRRLDSDSARSRQHRWTDMRRLVLVGILVGILSGVAGAAGRSWSGTWREPRAKGPAGTLRTVDRGGGDVDFQLEVWGGPPANNSGGAEGRVSVKGGKGVFETSEFGGLCRIEFSFTEGEVVVRQTKGSWAECGFGHSVLASGTFKRVSTKVPTFVRR